MKRIYDIIIPCGNAAADVSETAAPPKLFQQMTETEIETILCK